MTSLLKKGIPFVMVIVPCTLMELIVLANSMRSVGECCCPTAPFDGAQDAGLCEFGMLGCAVMLIKRELLAPSRCLDRRRGDT